MSVTDTIAPAADEAPARRHWLAALMRDPAAALAITVFLLIALAAILAPWLAPHDPAESTRNMMLPPAWAERGSAEFPLGTDGQGRDILSRLLHGTRRLVIEVVQPRLPNADHLGVRRQRHNGRHLRHRRLTHVVGVDAHSAPDLRMLLGKGRQPGRLRHGRADRDNLPYPGRRRPVQDRRQLGGIERVQVAVAVNQHGSATGT